MARKKYTTEKTEQYREKKTIGRITIKHNTVENPLQWIAERK